MFTVAAAEEMTFKFAIGQTHVSTSIAHVPLPALNIYLHLRVLNANGPILAGMDFQRDFALQIDY